MTLWLLGAAKMVLLAQAAWGAQAVVAGVIRDGQSGAPLPGAVITLPDVDRAAVSDSQGRYAVRGVPPGPQHVTIRRIGYAPRGLHALVPGRGLVEIDITLLPAPIRLHTVQVRPNVAIRGVDHLDSVGFPDRGISAVAMRNHPLLAEPDAFLALSGGEIITRPESPSGMHVRGGASDHTAYVLDGIPILNPYHAAGVFSAWNPDALEAVRLSSLSPSTAVVDALSGVISGATRTPGPGFRAQGGLSATQARVTADGPLGAAGARYLLSFRSGFPGVIAPGREPSYLKGGTNDLLATLHAPAFGGRIRLLGYDSGNDLDAAAIANAPDGAPTHPPRNAFSWHSRSVGGEWTGDARGAVIRVLAWSASASADALWDAVSPAAVALAAARNDDGVLAAVARRTTSTMTEGGLRLGQSRTSYAVSPAQGGAPTLSLAARTPGATLYLTHERPLATHLVTKVGLSATSMSRQVYASPHAQLRLRMSERLSFSGSYTRSHQYAQSLRNPESLAGTAFPADLYLGVGALMPVARSDNVILAAEVHATDGVRLGAQAYARDFAGIVLVAPHTGEPFAIASDLRVGSGVARGVSVTAAASGARYGFLASYGWQHVRLHHRDSSYVPEHGSAHVAEAGVIVFPTPTSSLRFGATGALGRRATSVIGDIEWETCNLADRGCEFAGTPRSTDRSGGVTLSPYLRLDVGLRKHWHLQLAGRDALVAVFGTVTNVLGRTNVLTTAVDPATGRRVELELRPRAPIALGFDWRL
jgi:hypothetical protein